MRRAVLLPAVLHLAAVISAGASEQPLDDLRLGVEARPTDATFTWEDGAARSGDQALSGAWGVAAGWRRGWGGAGGSHLALLGLELVGVDQRAEGLAHRALLLRGEAGWGVCLGERWLATLAPVAGGGPGRLRLDGAASEPLTLTGWSIEAGLRAGLRARLDARWSLQGEAGWLWGRDRLAGDGASVALRRSGPWLGLGLAWTIDPRPRPFE